MVCRLGALHRHHRISSQHLGSYQLVGGDPKMSFVRISNNDWAVNCMISQAQNYAILCLIALLFEPGHSANQITQIWCPTVYASGFNLIAGLPPAGFPRPPPQSSL